MSDNEKKEATWKKIFLQPSNAIYATILLFGWAYYCCYSYVETAEKETKSHQMALETRLYAIETRLTAIEKLVKSPVVVQLVSADGTRLCAVGGNMPPQKRTLRDLPKAPQKAVQKCTCGHIHTGAHTAPQSKAEGAKK